jgi:hypothetical protein
MKQPITGLVATLILIAISLGFIALFDFPTFSGWVTYLLICLIPMEIVIGVTWGCKFPVFAANQKQPVKGILLALILPVAGLVFGTIYYFTAGGGISPPTPMLAMCTIVSVIVTFWMAIMWGGWPFTAFIKNPVAAGVALVAACYAVNYVLFRIFFNYEFMRGAPIYVESLDPHGMFNAWYALVFYMSCIGVMFLMLHFDLWPLTANPALMKQPMLGFVWTVIALVVGGAAFYGAVYMAGMDVVAYMIRVPVAFIFGTIVVLNMMQASLFEKMTQPVKGIVSAAAAAVIGSVLAFIYGALAPTLSGQPLAAGPPGYDFERWLASALLGVTFPLLVMHADFFKFWPLQRAE